MQLSLKSFRMLSLFVIAVSGASKSPKLARMFKLMVQHFEPIDNGKGSLKCGKNGNYQASCINCSIRGNNELECMCCNADNDHRFVSAHVDLNNCISNDHGELGC
ncbi:uncharacterized protein N7483_009118 [Penicillium malachiteum]|uniref:uncharacterized protein n=1 Tax=Penicillium malachiteum TaxID=1324776 RepID=UPI002548D988|nr:uncharacterized protein N7483_009118 [Penicillium malachiteum]KAJ5721184.1 hypothetical protein N7483_009118 [Penicillium malachiteum]